MKNKAALPVMTARMVHPEQTPDEVWLGNVYRCDFLSIGWGSKRLGKQFLNSYGLPEAAGGMRPVFVRRAEVEAAGVEIPILGAIDHRWNGRTP